MIKGTSTAQEVDCPTSCCEPVRRTKLQQIDNDIQYCIERLARLQKAKELLTKNPGLEEIYNTLNCTY